MKLLPLFRRRHLIFIDMARGKKSPLVCRRAEEEKKKLDEALAEHVRLEMLGELSSVTISWKNKKRSVELVRLLAGTSWEVVKDLRDESKLGIVCPVCTLEIGAQGRKAPSIVPCSLFSVHLARIHQIHEDIYLMCPMCKKIPGWATVAKVESHYKNGGCSELAKGEADEGQNEGTDGETLRMGKLKLELTRSVRELQVWEVEKILAGQILVACPVCKLEKREGARVHESMVKSNQFKNHFEQEHKKQKFLLKVRVLKCPICQEFIPAGLLGVHFDQGRSCEKAVALANKVEVCDKEEESEVKMEVGEAGDPEAGTSAGEEYMKPDHKIKLEGGVIIKTEAVEEFYGVKTQEMPDLQISEEEILKAKIHREEFHFKEMQEEYVQNYIKKFLVDTDQPVTLLKRLTKGVFYKYIQEPKVGKEWGAWKCWITSKSGVTICARDSKKKGAMRKVAIKALSQLFSINPSQPS